MAKSILSTCMNFYLHSFKQGTPAFRVYTPLEYSFSDLAQIINIYCGYNHTDYDFLYHEYLNCLWDADSKNMVSLKTYFNNRNFDK